MTGNEIGDKAERLGRRVGRALKYIIIIAAIAAGWIGFGVWAKRGTKAEALVVKTETRAETAEREAAQWRQIIFDRQAHYEILCREERVLAVLEAQAKLTSGAPAAVIVAGYQARIDAIPDDYVAAVNGQKGGEQARMPTAEAIPGDEEVK